MSIARDALFGREFDFAARDECGHVALISTAGYGHVPAAVLDVDEVADAEQLLLSGLPISASARPEGRGPGTCGEWQELGRRGVFVYDWRHWRGPYDRIIVPEPPIVLETLIPNLIFVPVAGCFSALTELTDAFSS